MPLGRRMAVLATDVRNPKPMKGAGNVLEDRIIPAGTAFVHEIVLGRHTAEKLSDDLFLLDDELQPETEVPRRSALFNAIVPKLERAPAGLARLLVEYIAVGPESILEILSRAVSSGALKLGRLEKIVREFREEMDADVDADDVLDLEFAAQDE